MPKLKISKKQYDTIILREQNERLGKAYINESLLEEGIKDWILGAALIITQALGNNSMAQSGHNKVVADRAVKNEEVMGKIKSTLEDSTKIGDLVDAMEKLGMKNPTDLLAKNASKVVDEFNKVSNDSKLNYHVDNRGVDNLQSLNLKLAQGFALKDVKVTNDTVKSQDSPISIKDTLDVNFGSDNFFVSGGYELSDAGRDSIIAAVSEIHKQGGKIISIDIETSTDAEQMLKYKNENDPTGNIKLAQMRSKSVIDFIKTMDDGASTTHREIPNNGSNVTSTKDFIRSAGNKVVTQTLREKTSQFRYVKLSITAVIEHQGPAGETPPEIIKKYRYEIVKVITNTAKAKKLNVHVHFTHKQFKCSKLNVKDKISQTCETFK